MRFASRTAWSMQTNAITRTVQQWCAAGKPFVDLTVSNPTACALYGDEASALLKAFTHSAVMTYCPKAQGLLEARQAIVQYYRDKNINLDPAQICLTSSTSEGYAYIMRLLVNPGEKILFPSPSYPLFHYLSGLNDVTAVYYPLRYDQRWHMDIAAVEDLIDEQTRAIVCVNPNNPTGVYVSVQERDALNQLCQKYNLVLISDEVFNDYALEKNKRLSLASNQKVPTIILNGLSKMLGLPQMKLSWIVLNGPEEMWKAMLERLEVIADTYLSVNTSVQEALSLWLTQRASFQSPIVRRIQSNWTYLTSSVGHKASWEVLYLEGGWSAIVRLPAIMTDEEWGHYLLDKASVLVHPGYLFDLTPGAMIVMSLLPQEELFQEGVTRFGQCIEQAVFQKK